MSHNIPEKLGKYSVIEEIDRGSMGVVYLGHDPYIDRQVALKVAFLDELNDPESGERYRKMFFNEAHTAGLLTHPNVINIFDAGVDEDNCYIVMEYIEGGNTLKQYCTSDNLLPVNKVVEIIFKCANALDYAHRQGVVHRDIKPSNILITPEQDVKIGDFSIAHIHNADSTTTQMGGMMGSPRYMSPEQLREEHVTTQTDLYSLGIVMYELLTGRQAFPADNFSRLVNKILNDEVPPMSDFRSDLPEALNKIVFKAMERNVVDRYQMGLDLAADLTKAFDNLEQPKEDISAQEKFDAVKKLEFFTGFPDAEIWEILRASTWQDYGSDDDIIVEGDMDDCFYIIVNGDVQVMKGHSVIRTLQKGDCFGEMGYLAKTKRTASIKSRNSTSLMKINSTVISQVSLNCQVRFLKVFLRTLIHRLSATTEKVSQEL
ncbi:MAG: protein kinase [Proteobacteria bacterium]|nr:serine/threonine protein kinase [Pseudomonadota bacterium]NOG61370.1 protein kinase [Pseudomonadota bacterium]